MWRCTRVVLNEVRIPGKSKMFRLTCSIVSSADHMVYCIIGRPHGILYHRPTTWYIVSSADHMVYCIIGRPHGILYHRPTTWYIVSSADHMVYCIIGRPMVSKWNGHHRTFCKLSKQTKIFRLVVQFFGCASFPGCRWNVTQGRTSTSGVVQPTALTLVQCLSACLKSNLCGKYGADWISTAVTGQKCMFPTSDGLISTPAGIHFQWTCFVGMKTIGNIYKYVLYPCILCPLLVYLPQSCSRVTFLGQTRM